MRPSTRQILLWLPFAVMAGVGVARGIAGPGWGLATMVVVGPALAAVAGHTRRTVAAGAVAVAICLLDAAFFEPPADYRAAWVAVAAIAVITAIGVMTSRARERHERELAQVTLIAETVQQVLLQPVPSQVGPLRLTARYLSATSGARVGGDLYGAVTTPDGLRLIIGDAVGKGLPALRRAATVLSAFREAAPSEPDLSAVVCRIERSLARELGDEQFVTAALAEVNADATKLELLNCGHPPPLLLGTVPPQPIGGPHGSLPLGLADLADEPRTAVTIELAPSSQVLFYTDGATEARDKAGTFFPLTTCQSLTGRPDSATLLDRLSHELIGHLNKPPNDDVALLLLYRDSREMACT